VSMSGMREKGEEAGSRHVKVALKSGGYRAGCCERQGIATSNAFAFHSPTFYVFRPALAFCDTDDFKISSEKKEWWNVLLVHVVFTKSTNTYNTFQHFGTQSSPR